MNKFIKSNLNFIYSFVGKKLIDILYQPVAGILSDGNVYILNFENEYSLHIFCFMRIHQNGKILLTSSDEYFNVSNEKLTDEEYRESLNNKFNNTLLLKNIKLVKKLIKNIPIKTILVNDVADIIIELESNIVIEIKPDCLYNNYEYYRIFSLKKHSVHHVVSFIDGNILYSSSQ